MTKLEYEVKLNDIKNKIEEAEKNENWMLARLLIYEYNRWLYIAELDIARQEAEKEFERYKRKVRKESD